MKTTDVVIVGAGLIGVAAALQLRAKGLTVVVVDRQEPGREASSAAAGMLAPGPDNPSSLPLVPLGKASLALYPEFVAHIERASGKTTGFAQKGALELFFGDEGEPECDRFIAEQKELGLRAEKLSGNELLRMEPSAALRAVAAAWLSEEGIVNPLLLIDAAVTAAKIEGVEVWPNCGVSGLIRDGNRCTGVVTAAGPISSSRVVIAAGCFSRAVDNAIARYAPTIPVRGQMLALRTAGNAGASVKLHHVLRSTNGYLVPHEDGRILAGSTLEPAANAKVVTPGGMRKITGAAIEIAPALQTAEIVESWAGLRPGTPDGLPVLGLTDIEGLIIATGHYRNGILLAPITAKLVEQWVLGIEGKHGVSAFSPMRFAQPAASAHTKSPARQATV